MKYLKKKRIYGALGYGVRRNEDCLISTTGGKTLRNGEKRTYLSLSFSDEAINRCFKTIDYIYIGISETKIFFINAGSSQEGYKISKHVWNNQITHIVRVPIDVEIKETLEKFIGYYNLDFDPVNGVWYADLGRKVR